MEKLRSKDTTFDNRPAVESEEQPVSETGHKDRALLFDYLHALLKQPPKLCLDAGRGTFDHEQSGHEDHFSAADLLPDFSPSFEDKWSKAAIRQLMHENDLLESKVERLTAQLNKLEASLESMLTENTGLRSAVKKLRTQLTLSAMTGKGEGEVAVLKSPGENLRPQGDGAPFEDRATAGGVRPRRTPPARYTAVSGPVLAPERDPAPSPKTAADPHLREGSPFAEPVRSQVREYVPEISVPEMPEPELEAEPTLRPTAAEPAASESEVGGGMEQQSPRAEGEPPQNEFTVEERPLQRMGTGSRVMKKQDQSPEPPNSPDEPVTEESTPIQGDPSFQARPAMAPMEFFPSVEPPPAPRSDDPEPADLGPADLEPGSGKDMLAAAVDDPEIEPAPVPKAVLKKQMANYQQNQQEADSTEESATGHDLPKL